MEGKLKMVDIDSRPDLTSLLVQLSDYDCIYTEDDQIIVKIPDFSWYGIALNCMSTSSIMTYLVETKGSVGTVYLKTFYNNNLDTIIKESIEESKICKKCGSHNANLVIGPNIICAECASKIRSRY